MRILWFLAANWDSVLVVIFLVLSVVTGLKQWVKRHGPIFKEMSVMERVAYITRLLANLAPLALVLITDAEIHFGKGTGKLKRAYVMDELYKRIPDEYKKYITEDNLDAIINAALEEAENLWANNTNVKAIVKQDNQINRQP